MAEAHVFEPGQEVLILTPTGRDGPTAASLLDQAGLRPRVCLRIEEVCDRVGTAAVVLVAEEALATPKASAALRAALEYQPAWSEIPVVLLSGAHARSGAHQASVRLGAYSNLVVLERPLRTATLVTALRAAHTSRKRQYQIRDYLEERRQQAETLERLNESLEQRVLERTRDLEEAMRQRQEAERALRQAQKIEAIGQLTGGIAHDFNNLLMVIAGGFDLLNRSSPERRERLLAGMRQATTRGQALTRQLLAFSRRMTLTPEPIELKLLLDGMRILVDGALRGDIVVEVEIAPDLWPILADPTQLELALLNLAVNARDAMPFGGRLTISARNRRSGNGGGGRDMVEIEVGDTGEGIPREVIERVFDPFFTTKPVGKGTGLGLSQVHGFATQSGGEVAVSSEPGRGARFALRLPRAQAEPRPVTPIAVDGDHLVLPDVHSVLLVEDNDQVAELVTQMLEALGLQVERVSSAQEALIRLDGEGGADVVFSDIVMPGGMSGIELARELRRRRPDLPVLLATGYSDAARSLDPDEGLKLIEKPYQLDTLKQALGEVVERAHRSESLH
ncbi:MAG TPA: ATP-binding protein [Caulobacteraceae bacterium]